MATLRVTSQAASWREHISLVYIIQRSNRPTSRLLQLATGQNLRVPTLLVPIQRTVHATNCQLKHKNGIQSRRTGFQRVGAATAGTVRNITSIHARVTGRIGN